MPPVKHRPRRALLVFSFFATAVIAGAIPIPAHAAGSPEHTCQKGRYIAAAKYSACEQKALAKVLSGGINQLDVLTGKCQMKYAATWSKLQAKTPTSTCDTSRFTDNGTTVSDNLTGLQWEKKQNLDGSQNLADPHDADNLYTWNSLVPPYTAADGAAFTTFLPALNSGGCLAGQCDWRLPTIYELQTVLAGVYPSCGITPCIDSVFGPTVAGTYWSATSGAWDGAAGSPAVVWAVVFNGGYSGPALKSSNGFSIRAVRGGL